MSLLEYTADFKGVEKQLRRIADALDVVLKESYGYQTAELLSKKVPQTKEEESLEYTTDESAAVQEAKQAIEEIEKGKGEDV